MLDFAIDLAYRAGALLRAAAERERSLEAKQHSDIVSDADKASEALVLGAIRERFPGHAILAEESGASAGTGGDTWVVDPLDGTLNYVHGFPFYCVSIALVRDGEPQIGVVFDPVRGELFAAERGAGARANGRRLHVSATPALDAALLTTGFPYSRFSQPDNNLREFARLSLRAREIRRSGSAALELCYVAAGRSDGHWELELNAWDLAAGALIVREAGGVVSDWRGRPWALEERRVVASNGHIHAELLRELAAA